MKSGEGQGDSGQSLKPKKHGGEGGGGMEKWKSGAREWKA